MSGAGPDFAPERGEAWRVVTLCLLVAIVEGIDIQSVGVAASGIAQHFNLGPTALGFIMSTSILGLMIGAAIGGWASDLIGRKRVLIASMALLGSFTLATIVSPDVKYLVAARLLAGIGLGGAFPALIALISETVDARYRGIGMGAMYCGLPIGGAVAGLTMAGRAPTDWEAVFHLGGWAPLFLVIVLAVSLRETRPSRVAPDIHEDEPVPARIFGSGSASTLLLWISFFFTLLVVYTLLNWLPSLFLARGIARAEALHLSMTMNLGAAAGGLATGLAIDAWRLSGVVGAVYVGMIASLGALVLSEGAVLYGAAFAVGFFVIGGQLVLYAIAPRLYPAPLRGRGVGAAVSVGRGGSIAGPALAGALLGIGISAEAIPLFLTAGLLCAMIAAAALVRTPVLAAPARSHS